MIIVLQARDKVEEIKTRFGGGVGPMLYELRRAIYTAKQGKDSVAVFYNMLKGLWEELICLETGMRYGNYEEEKMMLFLIRLNYEFESTRNQILLYDPLPNLAMAYGMIANVEKQKKLHIHVQAEVSATQAALRFNPRSDQTSEDKFVYKCDNCGKRGHLRTDSFKLKGFLDWWHGFNQKMKEKANMVQEMSTPLEILNEGRDGWQSVISTLIHQEVGKVLKGKDVGCSEQLQTQASPDGFDHFAGSIVSKSYLSDMHIMECWIIDSGASTHMCNNLSRFSVWHKLKQGVSMNLSDNTTKEIEYAANINLHGNIVLKNYLFVPSFKYNLLSINKASETNGDVESSKILPIAKADKRLYVLSEESFECSFIQGFVSNCIQNSSVFSCNVSTGTTDAKLWHSRLGHVSSEVLKKLFKDLDFNFSTKPFYVCPLTKQQRLIFNKACDHSTILFELVHIDLWGPYKVATRQDTFILW
ncbi:hypothetical protein LIER_33744 [Lithospermum erythrorhizon]|uniref:GAG-pre-integrase domain-containing protein n=1 Tax=Lithospermum erythrorhizon TaxID=34254 RepID=A0AAV3RXI7_LITER